jgi:DNA-binding helix-hairpin-helix protein with protein kinase domain
MTTRAKLQVFNSQRQTLSLTSELGRGGEGSIYEVYGQPDLVAKVYHKPIEQEKASKLALMARLRTDRLLELTAWPIDTLHETQGGRVSGFLMRRVSNYKEIHILYSPKSRFVEFPDAGWPFLIHAATNVARAFSVIHDHGHVVGDVNHANILVSNKATTMLIDCDSFQVSAQGQQYLCEVGISTHTPPELQGRSFRGVVRSGNHDSFGLAVIIFQLLFMGRHPFSGAFTGPGEMTLERAIKEFRFAYGPGATSRQMKQPPGTLPLDAVSQTVTNLFERAFLSEAGRPKPNDWLSALSDLSKNLKQCASNSNHYYLKMLSACSWCEVESQSRVIFFKFLIKTAAPGVATFNLAFVWSKIRGISPPSPPPALTERLSIEVGTSPKADQFIRNRRFRKIFPIFMITVVIATVLIKGIGGFLAFGLIASAIIIGFSILNLSDNQARQAFEKAGREADELWELIQIQWQTDASDKRFHDKMRELEAKRREYENLPNLKQQKLKQLEKDRLEHQRHRFLDQYRIDTAGISGIGPSLTTILQSYGIETAADIEQNKIAAVPGLTTFISKLVDWRRSIEQKFVFNAAQGIDPADIEAMEQEMARIRTRLERELLSGPSELSKISEQIKISRDALLPVVEETSRALAQAEADLKAIR